MAGGLGGLRFFMNTHAHPSAPSGQAGRLYVFEVTRRPGRVAVGAPVPPRRVAVWAAEEEAAVWGAGINRDELYRAVPATPWASLAARRPVRADEIADTFATLGSALTAGQPMIRALGLAARLVHTPRMRGVLGSLALAVSRGETLPRAMSRWPTVFTPMHLALAEAAAQTGLNEAGAIFRRLAGRLHQDNRLRRKFLGAIAYPLSLVAMALAATLVLELKALPPMVELFRAMGAALPPITQAFYALAGVLEAQAFLLVPAASLALAVAWWSGPRLLRWPALQRLLLRCWLIGPIVRSLALARALSTFLLLKQAGARNRDIFALAGAAADNAGVADFFARTYRRVTQGESVEDAFLAERLALGDDGLRIAGRMEVGLAGGDLGELLQQTVDDLLDRADTRVALLPKALELPLLALCGLMIGSILLAMFLPYPTLLGDIAQKMH